MRFHQLLRRALVAAALSAAVPAGAQSSPTDDARGAWMLGLGAQVDEEEGESLLGTLYVGVGSSTWLTFVAGQSSSPADRANIEADTLVLGVDHRFDQVGFTLEAERWGDPDALETEDLAGSVYFDPGRWRIGFRYEARDIEIPFTLTGPLGGTLRRDGADVRGQRRRQRACCNRRTLAALFGTRRARLRPRSQRAAADRELELC